MVPGPTARVGAESLKVCSQRDTGSPRRSSPLPLWLTTSRVCVRSFAWQTGPTIVVGHSYCGHVMTALGTDAPGVVGLVYVAAFALDEGETLGALLAQGPVPPALVHQSVDDRGFVWLAEDDFTNHFAADVDPVTSRVMFAVQQPLASNTFNDAMGVPAWRSLPSWYLIATEDQAIPPPAQQMFAKRMGATTIDVPSSHLAMVSHPKDVLRLTTIP